MSCNFNCCYNQIEIIQKTEATLLQIVWLVWYWLDYKRRITVFWGQSTSQWGNLCLCVYECEGTLKCIFLYVLSWRHHWAKEGPSSATLLFTSVLLTHCSSVLQTRRLQGQKTHTYIFLYIHVTGLTPHSNLSQEVRVSLPNLSLISVFPDNAPATEPPTYVSLPQHYIELYVNVALLYLRFIRPISFFMIYISITRECWAKSD